MDSIERVYGALLGLYVGDGFGSQTDTMEESQLSALGSEPLDQVYSLEELRPLCGMSGEPSDLASLFAISIISEGRLDKDHLTSQVLRYGKEEENHLSQKVLKSLKEGATDSEVLQPLNLSLLLAITLLDASDKQIPAFCTRLTSLFTTNTQIEQAVILLVSAFSLLLNEEARDSEQLLRLLSERIRRYKLDSNFSKALQATQPPRKTQTVYELLQLVFALINQKLSFTDGIISIAKRGGEARLSCALYGGLKAAMHGPEVIDQLWIDEIFPSPALQTMFKYQTLYKRETITMDKLATLFSKRLLDISLI